MLAGWLSAFRNRAYLGWLGLGFMALSAYLLAYDRARTEITMGLPDAGAVLGQKVALVVVLACFVLALITAVRETGRRIRTIRESHQAAEEAMLAMIQASLGEEKQQESGVEPERPGGDDQAPPA